MIALTLRSTGTTASAFTSTSQYQQVAGLVTAAASAGRTAANAWLSANPALDAAAGADAALRGLSGPPPAASQQAELTLVQQIQASRTAAQTTLAHTLNATGDGSLWLGYLHQWQHTVPTAQAAQGAALLQDALTLTSQAADQEKRSFPRDRPFKVDPSLVPIDAGSLDPSASYPSGHAAASFAAAAVLSNLMPSQAQQFETMAVQVAYSRVYSAVHFPSDVAAGAQLGTFIGDTVVARDSTSTTKGLP